MSEHNTLTEYLKNNPRFIGVLCTITLLLTQTSGALAEKAGTVLGP